MVRALSHSLRRVLFGRALALLYVLGPRSLARMDGDRRRAGPALIQRAREACTSHRHAAVDPDRRGHGGPDAVQPRCERCVCLLGENAERTKRLQLFESVFPKMYHVHPHPEGSLVLVFSRLLSHASLQL
jgi:hypothetical protein